MDASGDTPAIAVRWGTRPDQETVTGTLATIADRIEASGLKPPATVIIGEVVALHEKLNWFEKLPLFGRKIVVTRAADQAAELSERLRALGADAIELPVISLEPPADPAPLDRAIENLASYDWLIFTSVNGVRFFLDRLDQSPHDLRSLKARICAIGPATRKAIEDLHLKVDLMPEEYVAESLVEAFAGENLAGKKMLAAARRRCPRRDSGRTREARRSSGRGGSLSKRCSAELRLRAPAKYSPPRKSRIGSRSPALPPSRICSRSRAARRWKAFASRPSGQ